VLVKLRSRLTYANVMATIAVFVALGGSSVAAISLKRNSVKGKHIATNAVTSPKVKNASLLARDFAPGQLPKGEQGPQGSQGPPGERGPQGSGAVPIAYTRPVPTLGDTFVDSVAGVGPWTVKARCRRQASVSGQEVVLDLLIRGPGNADWAGVTAPDDGETSENPDTGGRPLTGTGDDDLGGVLASAPVAGSHGRLAYDIQLRSGPTTATVSLNGVADRRDGASACLLSGTAIPAG